MVERYSSKLLEVPPLLLTELLICIERIRATIHLRVSSILAFTEQKVTQDSHNGLLKQLSVIVPTKNRQSAAVAAAYQWAQLVAKVIVIDASAQSAISRFSGIPNVVYLHDTSSKEVRYCRAAELVETAYGMLQSDDDVFVPSAIAECLQWLSNNCDYAAVSPTALSERNSRYGITYRKALRWNNRSDRKAERLDYLGINYTPSSIYGVARSEYLRLSFSSMAINPIPVFAFGELHHEFVMNGLGKVRVLPVVGWIRRSTYDKVDPRSSFSAPEWFANSEGVYARQFVDGVARTIVADAPDSFEEVRRGVSSALSAYARAVQQARRASRATVLRRKVKDTYKRVVPRRLYNFLKPIVGWLWLGLRKESWPWESIDVELQSAGVSLPADALVTLRARELLETTEHDDER